MLVKKSQNCEKMMIFDSDIKSLTFGYVVLVGGVHSWVWLVFDDFLAKTDIVSSQNTPADADQLCQV